MSNQLLTKVLMLPVKGPGKAVLMVLADYADDAGKCWPSHATIAEKSGVCKATVKNSLRKLKSDGLLTWETTITETGDAGSNNYRLTLGGGVRDTPPRARDASQVGQEVPQGGAGDSYKPPMEPPIEPKELFDSPPLKSKPLKSKATLEEVVAFVKELGLPESDGQAMFYGWESSGWIVGKNPIKCWKSQIRRHKASGWLPSQKSNGSNQQPAPETPPGSVVINGRAFKA